MFDESHIASLLQAEGISLAGEPIKDSGVEGHFFVYVSTNRDSENRQIPSNRILNKARDMLAENGVHVEFLLTDAYAQDIEAGLRATLLHAFGDYVRNSFLSMNDGSANVWIEQKKTLEDEVKVQIERKIHLFVEDFDIKVDTISTTNNENLPTKFALLKSLRQIAPASVMELKHFLVSRQFVVPSDDWLNRRLDALRRAGAVVRVSTGTYSLSLQTLQNLGTEKNGHRSPDVSRLLALARKR